MKILNWLFVLLGIAGLIGIRFLEDRLFDDPFIKYFHEGLTGGIFPEVNWTKLILHHLFRFLLNLGFSLLIVHHLFRKVRWTVQAAVLMMIFFVITFLVYLYCLHSQMEFGALFTFYMRRFVIQPIILLLIIPLFYYREHIERQAT